ncbi:MAG: hypothetical protein JXD18_05080 [Anaerolineae bacterium]|nr:hypothetical protein [Anaerolineae bacterium]
MKLKRHLVLAMLVLGIAASCRSPGTDGEVLLADRCFGCHSQAEIAETGRSYAGWTHVVNWMKTYGVELTEEEQERLVDYLVDTYGE